MSTPDDVKARVAHAYNHAADHYDHAANAFWQRAGRRTIERLRLAPGARVVDLCCGTGASALPAAQAVGPSGRVVAVDLAAELVALGRAMVASFVRPGGRLEVTTWGAGLFEPVNSHFWEAIRRVRPELHKAFNPWDCLGERPQVVELFERAGLPEPAVELERGSDVLRGEADLTALLMGTGYRGVMESLSEEQRSRVLREVVERSFSRSAVEIGTDVLYASAMKTG